MASHILPWSGFPRERINPRLLIDDMDNEHGLERKIPAGTRGIITNIDESPFAGFHYHVEFDNGGWLIFYPDELSSHLELV